MSTRRKKKRRQRDAQPVIAPPARPDHAPTVVAILCPLLVLVAGFVAFWPALDAQFVNYDDDRLFVNNTSYRGFDADRLHWMFTTTFMGHYQPLTWLSSALDFLISGIEPASYHRTNLLLHAFNGLMLYYVALRLLAAALRLAPGAHPTALRFAAAVAALLFAVHPLRVESVAWASERRDVLSTALLLLTLAAYLRAVRPAQTALLSRRWFAASCGLLVLSLLSKAWGMSFVVVVTILDVYPLRRLPGEVSRWWHGHYRALWLQKVPFLLLGLAAAAKAGQAQRSALQTMKGLDEWGIVERLAQTCYGLTFYIAKTVWPARLSALYELPYRLDPVELRYILSYFAVAGGVATVLLLRRRLPSVAAAALIYVIILAPVLGIAQSGPQLVADKYSYVSCMSWALLAGGGLLYLSRGRRSSPWAVIPGLATVAVLLVFLVSTYRQTSVWHDSKSLWTHALIAAQPSSTAHLNYGILLRRAGRTDQAIEHYRAATTIRPDCGEAWYALGNALKAQRQYTQAEPAYRQAVTFMAEKSHAYLNLGNMYYNNLKRTGDAIKAYRAAIDHMRASPKTFTPVPYLALGIALERTGDLDGARTALTEAARHPRTRDRAVDLLAELGEVRRN